VFYTAYKTTHLASGKTYIGVHKTKRTDDRYLGSGTYLKKAIRKHGAKAFKKDVLYIFDSEQEMLEKERELVDEAFVARRDTYNLSLGGLKVPDNTHVWRAHGSGQGFSPNPAGPGTVPWNKGKTKKTCSKVRENAKAIAEATKRRKRKGGRFAKEG